MKAYFGVLLLFLSAYSLFFPRAAIFLFIASFAAPVGVDIWQPDLFLEFPHLGKSAGTVRMYLVDLPLLVMIISSRRHRLPSHKGKITADMAFLAGYVFLAILSCFWSVNRFAAYCEILNVLKLLCVAAYFTRNHGTISENIGIVSKAFLGIVVVQIAFSVVQIYTGTIFRIGNLVGYADAPDVIGERFGFVQPVGSVGALLPFLVSVVAIWSYAFFAVEADKTNRRLNLFTLLSALLLIVANQSRTDVFGALVAFFVLLWLNKGWGTIARDAALATIGVVFFALWVSSNVNVPYFIDHFVSSLDFRLEMDRQTIQTITQSPFVMFLGFGQNNSIDNVRYFTTDLYGQARILPVHNFYLFEWSESGIVGVLLLAGYFLRNYYAVYRRRAIILASSDNVRGLYAFVFGFGAFLVVDAAFGWVICFYELRLLSVVLLCSAFSCLRNTEMPGSRVVSVQGGGGGKNDNSGFRRVSRVGYQGGEGGSRRALQLPRADRGA